MLLRKIRDTYEHGESCEKSYGDFCITQYFINLFEHLLSWLDSSGPWSSLGEIIEHLVRTLKQEDLFWCAASAAVLMAEEQVPGEERASRKTSAIATFLMAFLKPCGLPAAAHQNSSRTKVTLYQLAEVLRVPQKGWCLLYDNF